VSTFNTRSRSSTCLDELTLTKEQRKFRNQLCAASLQLSPLAKGLFIANRGPLPIADFARQLCASWWLILYLPSEVPLHAYLLRHL
jgi:hypothetical protein